MRPVTLEELVGQPGLLARGAAAARARERAPALDDPARSARSGKTTLARIIAGASGAEFEEHSAVDTGRAEVRAVIERARHRGRATVFFLDEIHRFNKAQQDALLPAVEEGLVTLIGATTENPRFEVNSALLSRVTVYELEPLSSDDVAVLLRRALERGELGTGVALDDDAVELLATRAGGDARIALSALERRRDAPADRPRRRARRARGGWSATTAPATSTTTRSPRGSRRLGARTRTPRSTTWRRCSRAARTPLHRAPDVILASETSATPTAGAGRGRLRGRGGRARRPAECSYALAQARSTSRSRRSPTPPAGRSAPRAS